MWMIFLSLPTVHFNEFLRYKFKSITINVGLIHSYLGMTLDFNPNNAVEVSMKGYIKQFQHRHHQENRQPIETTLADEEEADPPADPRQLKRLQQIIGVLLDLGETNHDQGVVECFTWASATSRLSTAPSSPGARSSTPSRHQQRRVNWLLPS
jgi:hypothetical protein